MLPDQFFQDLVEAKRILKDVGLRPSGSNEIDRRFKMQPMLAKLLIPNKHARNYRRIRAQCDGRQTGSGARRNVEVVRKNTRIQSRILINQNSDA